MIPTWVVVALSVPAAGAVLLGLAAILLSLYADDGEPGLYGAQLLVGGAGTLALLWAT